jgi:hypothetical protein
MRCQLNPGRLYVIAGLPKHQPNGPQVVPQAADRMKET